jgi:hypothetical protein
MNPTTLTKPALSGMLQSTFMLCFFTVFWSAFLFWSLGFTVAAFIAFFGYLLFAVQMFRFAKRTAKKVNALPDVEKTAADKAADKKWSIIFSVQGMSIGAVCAALGMLGRYEYIVPCAALIVGLHYFPLGVTYKTAIHHIAGAVVSAISIGGIIAVYWGYANAAIGLCAAVSALATLALGFYLLNVVNGALENAI